MPVNVFVGYRDSNGDYHGYLGKLSVEEYRRLREVARKASSPTNLSDEWMYLDGRTETTNTDMSEGDKEAGESVLKYFREHLGHFDEESDEELTFILFRAVRNSLLKSRRTGQPVISSKEWPERIELF